MQFEKGHIYHIYNQGNNRQKIFFNRDNYLFFLTKMKKYILPYGDILAWCLMPNHFHLMVVVNEVEVNVERFARLGVSQRHAESERHFESESKPKLRDFNASIGIMLMAYAKAINKQQHRSGKLFREQTKAECINCPKLLVPNFLTEAGLTKIDIKQEYEQYPQICFDYIHQNPVKAGLVKLDTDWEFSSARDYVNLRNGKLINRNIAEKYIDL